jgi:hypothetical protein
MIDDTTTPGESAGDGSETGAASVGKPKTTKPRQPRKPPASRRPEPRFALLRDTTIDLFCGLATEKPWLTHGEACGVIHTPAGTAVMYADGCVYWTALSLIAGPHFPRAKWATPPEARTATPAPERPALDRAVPKTLTPVWLCAECSFGDHEHCAIRGLRDEPCEKTQACFCALINHPSTVVLAVASNMPYDHRGNRLPGYVD